VIDNWTRQRRGDTFFGSGTKEERGRVHLRAGHSAHVRVEYNNVRGPADGDEDMTVMDSNPAVQLGGTVVEDADESMAQAVRLAKEADVAVVVVGLSAEWETEGNDRYTLALPGRTDELVEKVFAANPKTIVVVQSVRETSLPSSTALSICFRARQSPCLGRTRCPRLYTPGTSAMPPATRSRTCLLER
jgi:beta-glucosidase